MHHPQELSANERNAAWAGDDSALKKWAYLHGWRLTFHSLDIYRLIHEDPAVEAYIDFLGDELLSREEVLIVLSETDGPAAEAIRKIAN
jgi:hypothetical protein